MKRLVLIRHAKSDWNHASLKDYDRPLNARGIRVAPKMGSVLKERNYLPNMIVSSAAERAKSTAEYIAEQVGVEKDDIVLKENLYLAPIRTLLSEINSWQSGNCVFLVNHNPDISYLAEYLSGDDVGELPTAGVAVIDFQIDDWLEVSQNTGNLLEVFSPEQLGF